MSCILDVSRNILPFIAQYFESLHLLAMLRCTCKEIHQDTRNFTLLYRIILQNVGWMNKTTGKQAFILNHQDIKEVQYINSSLLTYSEKIIAGFPRGHLVEGKTLFEKALTKYGSIQGICDAHIKRQKRRTEKFKAKFLAESLMVRCSLETLFYAMQNPPPPQ